MLEDPDTVAVAEHGMSPGHARIVEGYVAQGVPTDEVRPSGVQRDRARAQRQQRGRRVGRAGVHARTLRRTPPLQQVLSASTMRAMCPTPPSTQPFAAASPSPSAVWYVSYGSNMDPRRLRSYLEGGCPPGGNADHPGARDGTPPADSAGVTLPGRLYFAGRSRVWGGGGVAFYDHDVAGPT